MSFLLGIGTAVPASRRSQAETLDLALEMLRPPAREADRWRAVYRRAGVAFRHAAFLDDPDVARRFLEEPRPSTAERMRMHRALAGDLASRAASAALRDAGVDPGSVTHLITVSCTGFAAPGFELDLPAALDLAPDVERAHIGFMGCHGAINALRVARAHALADPESRVLVVAAEICSLHLAAHPAPDQVVANALFSDGAAAAVIGARPPSAGRARLSIAATGSRILRRDDALMAWTVGDRGFEMRLSARVPEVIRRELPPFLADWLGRRGRSLATVGSFAVHPGGPRILSAVEDELDLPEDALGDSREVLREYGNMSSPTVLFLLDRLRLRRAALPWLLLGFGPGLCVEAALVTGPE